MTFPTVERLLELYERFAETMRWEKIHRILVEIGEHPTDQEARDVAARIRDLLREHVRDVRSVYSREGDTVRIGRLFDREEVVQLLRKRYAHRRRVVAACSDSDDPAGARDRAASEEAAWEIEHLARELGIDLDA